jgi:3-deoxy-D-manno-octulosonic-acid transferase
LEPLKLGVPTFSGPHMFNFTDMLPILATHELMQPSQSLPELHTVLEQVLTDAPLQQQQRQRIVEVMPTLTGATATATQTILEVLHG